ncbi:MAG: cell division protein FtsQ/DivIB [Balneolaceae bacterium]
MSKSKKHTKKDRLNGKSSILGISFSIILLGFAVFAGFYMEKNTYIQSVKIEGNYYVDESELLEVFDSPVGLRADSVQFDSIFKQIKEVPYVKNVSVSMSIRGSLTFIIEERQPLAILVNGSSQSYISEGGVLLSIIPEKVLNVPLTYGISAISATDSTFTNEYSQIESFLLAARENDVAWATLSEIAWTKNEGVIALTHENGVKLIFGENNFTNKLHDWKAFYSDVVTQKGIHAFDIIDLRFRDQIVTRNL